MSLPIVLMIIGIAALIVSIFAGTKQTSTDEIEQVSISLHQETSHLKKRLKALEEELMLEPTPITQALRTADTTKPVHSIIVSQITALHGQGYSIEEISKRSSLTTDRVLSVLRSKGVHV
ncbi:hypothetical protein DVB69_04225 [Sporosarcina sp. BI001-red]|uniref:hypothetical protein n=1 Tax=Sporosarcina sp. BI001-red TaxID=2282866 RepID=UPI000E25EB6C|nr:hypothetical protein [Sporosarcina sp. BI001-red]REB10019.1 hypothetical protein DVB69_04225 [Sporosarcina sp. BI001-red]